VDEHTRNRESAHIIYYIIIQGGLGGRTKTKEFTLPLVNPRLEPKWPESGVLNMHI